MPDGRRADTAFMLFLLQFFLLIHVGKGEDSVSVLSSKSPETVHHGNNVNLKCNLTIPAEVLQITWQKVQGIESKNIVTYSTTHGINILPPYNGRVLCSSMELTSSSMTIDNVTLEDNGCYKCLFNIYPDGAHEGQICFSVHPVSELKIELVHSNPNVDGILVVMCSATGKPAPNITFSNEPVLRELHKASFDQNADGTTTVTKLYSISKEVVKYLKLQNVSCVMNHPLRHEKKILSLTQEQEASSSYILLEQASIPNILIFPLIIFVMYF